MRLYDLLGVGKDAEEEEIEKNYKDLYNLEGNLSPTIQNVLDVSRDPERSDEYDALVLKLTPDEKALLQKLLEIQNAYDVLMDPIRRVAYNALTFTLTSTEEYLLQEIFSKVDPEKNQVYFKNFLIRNPECNIEGVLDEIYKQYVRIPICINETESKYNIPFFLAAIEELALRQELPQLTRSIAFYSMNNFLPSTDNFRMLISVVRGTHLECYNRAESVVKRISGKRFAKHELSSEVSSQTEFFIQNVFVKTGKKSLSKSKKIRSQESSASKEPSSDVGSDSYSGSERLLVTEVAVLVPQ